MIFAGGASALGEPSWTLQDPARNRFFRLDWLSYELLARWSLGEPEAILQSVRSQTPLDATPEDLVEVSRFLVESELVRGDAVGAPSMARREAERRKGALTWLLHNYLFMRFPLVRPDPWLERLTPRLEFVFRAPFRWLTLAALAFGLFELVQRWGEFQATFLAHLNVKGAALYAVVLAFVKICHEIGHAVTAKRYGCRVPTMGLALLVMWPLAYTDTSEAWKLASRRARLAISAAGIGTELILASWATAVWAVAPDGALRDAAFLLASTTWISTVAVNLNPLMRFDGYYLASDALDMPNLHTRAFALARWKLRRILFQTAEPAPEHLPRGLAPALVALAWATWIYRLVVYFGIALLVYHVFVKAVGILLFTVEVWWFLLGPVISEVQIWRRDRATLLQTRRARWTAVGAGLVAAWLLLPLPSHVSAGAVARPAKMLTLRVTGAGQVNFLAQAGRWIAPGEVIASLSSPKLDTGAQVAEADLDRAQAEAQVATADAQRRKDFSLSAAELSSAQAALQAAERQRDQMTIRAPFAGRLVDLEPEVGPGDWLEKEARLGVFADDRSWSATAYLTEDQVRKLKVGASGVFIRSDGVSAPARIIRIAPDGVRNLPNGLWAERAGVAAHLQQGNWVSDRPLFLVNVELERPLASADAREWPGRLRLDGKVEAPLARYARQLTAVLVREAGF